MASRLGTLLFVLAATCLAVAEVRTAKSLTVVRASKKRLASVCSSGFSNTRGSGLLADNATVCLSQTVCVLATMWRTSCRPR